MTAGKKWWEKESPRFECQPDCFKCCAKPGIVYFDKSSIENASKITNLSTMHFKKEFLKRDDGQWIHEVKDGNPCAFLTLEGCSIHFGKPIQCRSYPFWRENMTSKSMWKLVGSFCPGIDSGPHIAVATIRNFLEKFKL
jgi:Fe-S-cluster containining protein